MNKCALIVFQKNLIKGKVKTRIAATMGDEKALEIYGALVEHTHRIIKNIYADKFIFYSHYLEAAGTEFYKELIQNGRDLGERMCNAFEEVFGKNYDKVIIIGSDCYDLRPEIVEKAFAALQIYDTVIGPAKDGGYYLLGMQKLHASLFAGKTWSTSSVLSDTLKNIQQLGLSVHLLPQLNDIDMEQDLEGLPPGVLSRE